MAVKRWDKLGAVKFDAQETAEGFLQAPSCPVTKTGVFAYEMPDGTILRELRHPDDVFSAASLKTLEMIPLQVRHVAMLTPDNCKDLQAGQVGQDIKVGAPYVYAPVRITTKDGIEAARSGVNQLSCGYFCDVVMETGSYNGEAYDARQTNIVYNHLALCEQARLGPELRISMDAKDAIQSTRAARIDNLEKENPMLVKITLPNGLQYDAAPEVATEYTRMLGEFAQVKKDSATLTTQIKADADTAKGKADAEIEKVKGERDGFKAKLDAAEAEKAKLPKLIADSVRARLDLEKVAGLVLDEDGIEKIDSLSDEDVRKAVVLAKHPEAKLDGVSADYLKARFDSVVESLDESDEVDAMAEARAKVAPRQDGQPATATADAARARMISRLTGADKDKK